MIKQLPEERLEQLKRIKRRVTEVYNDYQDFKDWLKKEIPDIYFDCENPFFEVLDISDKILFSASTGEGPTGSQLEIDSSGAITFYPLQSIDDLLKELKEGDHND